MRYPLLLIFIPFFSHTSSSAQNLKSILTASDLANLESNDALYKHIQNTDFDSGFTGTLLIKKKDDKLKSIEIGTWKRKDSNYGDDATMVWDSIGRLLHYTEYNENNTLSFDCTYSYDTINGTYYRLEEQTIFNDAGNPITKGQRYWKMKKDTFGFYQSSRKQKFGKWEYFDGNQNLLKTKKYGEIK